jgi:1-acyl-sn-glycerol-3-phosphate acyltransferase
MHQSDLAWQAPPALAIMRWPLPMLGTFDRWLLRAAALVARRQVIAVEGLEHIRPAADPFILALNHSTRREAILVPALLVLLRGGRRIHFLADWNFRLIPGLDLVYRRAGAISVMRKPARPRLLNMFKPLVADPMPAHARARSLLTLGRPVGIFPEGTVNRDPRRLLAGRFGAARLSLATGVPIVPAGIRYPTADPALPIPPDAPLAISIGARIFPPRAQPGAQDIGVVRTWHAAVMTEIGRLSGKEWSGKDWAGKPGTTP